jgi:hypothetical protein
LGGGRKRGEKQAPCSTSLHHDRPETRRFNNIIILSNYTIRFNEETNFFKAICGETLFCPFCRGTMAARDSRPRLVIREDGSRETWVVRRLLCRSCGKIHTELPDFILPYKHYEASAIQKTLDEEPDNSCPADDSTLRRWRESFANAAPLIAALLTALCMKASNEAASLFRCDTVLSNIRAEKKHWLTFVFRLLINSGHRLRTRFAFCP